MTKFASVKMTRWAFYEAMDSDDKESMADWFETLYHHYQKRGVKINQLRAGDTDRIKTKKCIKRMRNAITRLRNRNI